MIQKLMKFTAKQPFHQLIHPRFLTSP
jgi:hypothetical protein